MADFTASQNTAKSQTQGWYNSEKINRENAANKAKLAVDQVDLLRTTV
jgi:hypothetical protein